MSVLEEVLLEEYDRTKRIISALKKELNTLPKGSVQEKIIGGRKYSYLVYREGKNVRSDYIKKSDIEIVRNGIAKRKENETAIKELQNSINQITKAVGKDIINEHTAKRVY